MKILHENPLPWDMAVGVYDCMTNEKYHAAPGISKSDLDQLHRSAAHYMTSHDLPHEETPDMRIGTALHCAVLEPERFMKTYTTVEGDRRTKAVRDQIKAYEERGCVVLTETEMAMVMAMRDSVMDSPNAVTLFQGAHSELSVFAWHDDIMIKCRPDIWNESHGLLIDLKTTTDASPKEVAKSVADFRYHVQDAWYRQVWERAGGAEAEGFIFIAVEKKPPYAVGIYTLSLDAKAQGWAEAMADVQVYRNAEEQKQWRGYSPKIEEIELPRWAQITL